VQFGNGAGKAKLTDVAIIQSGYNLFSCTKLQLKGWILGGDKNEIWLKKDDHCIKFDVKISTPKGMIFALFMEREDGAGAVEKPKDSGIVMEYKQAHDKLGHMGEEATRKAAKALGWTLTGTAGVCESCAVAKAKQKSVPKVTNAKPLQANEIRVYLDVSTLKP
jgi:hypothetical protein